MVSWERCNETSFLDKKAFYSELSLEDTPDEDYAHYQKVLKEFERKHLGDYHELYFQSDALLLADIF